MKHQQMSTKALDVSDLSLASCFWCLSVVHDSRDLKKSTQVHSAANMQCRSMYNILRISLPDQCSYVRLLLSYMKSGEENVTGLSECVCVMLRSWQQHRSLTHCCQHDKTSVHLYTFKS